MTAPSVASPVTSIDDLLPAIAARREQALERYRGEITRHLASQQRANMVLQSLLATVGQIYDETLRDLEALDLTTTAIAVDQGRSALTPPVLGAFQGFSARLLEQALNFNAASCALSNFADEQQPDAEYLNEIQIELAAAWRSFALEANLRLLPPGSKQA
ncbi:MAG TPA: hypothetical protein VGK09_09685 [Rhodocyclaceae bacterium]